MSESLLRDIDRLAARSGRITKLQAISTSQLLDQVASDFVQDRDRLRWWESLKGPTSEFRYGDEDGLKVLGQIVPVQADVLFVVTDDEFPPWQAYEGPIGEIISILHELPFFEYFMFQRSMEWVIFDTHANSLIKVLNPVGLWRS